jgi:hypothetical protein
MQRQPRIGRNNPYPIDELMLRTHRSAIGTLWRFRTEMLIPVVASACLWTLTLVMPLIIAGIILAALITTVMVLPWTRQPVIRRAWCVLSRHRIQRVCYETRMHTRSGRLPLVLRITPTEVGERALIWCRAGICAEDFEAHSGEIAAACYARQARISVSKQRAQLVTLDIVRHDTLAAHNVISPGLAPVTAEPVLVPSPRRPRMRTADQTPSSNSL